MRFGFRLNPEQFKQFIHRAMDATDPSRPGPMQDGMIAASGELWSFERSRFSLASGGDGTWEPLAQSTIANRISKGESPPLPILHETGALENSLHRGGAKHVLEVNGDRVVEGTEDLKARFHQEGTSRMPQRTIAVAPDDEALAEMKKQIVAGAQEAIAQAASGSTSPAPAANSAAQSYPQAA